MNTQRWQNAHEHGAEKRAMLTRLDDIQDEQRLQDAINLLAAFMGAEARYEWSCSLPARTGLNKRAYARAINAKIDSILDGMRQECTCTPFDTNACPACVAANGDTDQPLPF